MEPVDVNRNAALDRLRNRTQPWDIVIIGGGATGLGAAVDAATRGFDVALVDRGDFACGTSSRSTKLIHGGVRYLRQGNITLVREALRERQRLRCNAPGIVHDLPCIVPSYTRWDSLQYWVGLKLYDLLAGRTGMPRSTRLAQHETLHHLPGIRPERLRGATVYYDCQFDDAQLAIALARTATHHGAAVANYVEVRAFVKDASGRIRGVEAADQETGDVFEIPARIVINATGPYADGVKKLDVSTQPAMLTLSRGAHIVLDQSHFPGTHAMLVPRTPDGRVMFIIPWQGAVLVGTTDVSVDHADNHPSPSNAEIDYLLETANQYFNRPATRSDIRSMFAGLRPLVRPDQSTKTSRISREHAIHIDPDSQLITIIGGKWTTYRAMAEQLIDRVSAVGDLPQRDCVTAKLKLNNAPGQPVPANGATESAMLQPVCTDVELTGADVVGFCRNEMARTVEDVLSRRSRLLLLDARKALSAAPSVASIMADTLGRDAQWVQQQFDAFTTTAQRAIPI